jgi:hypothetical protein
MTFNPVLANQRPGYKPSSIRGILPKMISSKESMN